VTQMVKFYMFVWCQFLASALSGQFWSWSLSGRHSTWYQ